MTTTDTTAIERLRAALDEHGCRVRDAGSNSFNAQCPAHDDHNPSLSVRGVEGQALVKCHADCPTEDVLAALGWSWRDLYDNPRGAEYRYPDGRVVHRTLDEKSQTFKKFWQSGNTRGDALYRADFLAGAATVYVVEGEKDVHALESLGAVATCNPMGAGKAHKFDWTPLRDADVVIVADADEAGAKHAADIVEQLDGIAASVVTVAAKDGKDAADHVAAGYGLDALAAAQHEPISLCTAHSVYRRWLGEDYDLDVLDAVLCTAATEQLDGDPPWLLVVSGSGAAKTETVTPLGAAGACVTSTISSEGALLSGTSKRERSKDSTGGLLRKIGERGLLVIKDVTSVLSMNRDTRAAVLAALREVADGYWERNLGSDGGQSLGWRGRLVAIGAVTTAWDRAHDVISALGNRFVLVRLDSTSGRTRSGMQAIANTGEEAAMRAELSEATASVLAGVNTRADLPLTDDETQQILALADVVTLARTGVEHDYRGDVIDAHAPEMPTRFAKQLTQIMRGALALGVDRDRALTIVSRCARDSMPPLRLSVLLDVHAHPDSTTHSVRKRLQKPRPTVDRTLQALHMLGLVTLDEQEYEQRTVWRYRLADDVDRDALAFMGSTRNVSTHTCLARSPSFYTQNTPCTDISGTTPGALNTATVEDHSLPFAVECVQCGQRIITPRHMRADADRCSACQPERRPA